MRTPHFFELVALTLKGEARRSDPSDRGNAGVLRRLADVSSRSLEGDDERIQDKPQIILSHKAGASFRTIMRGRLMFGPVFINYTERIV